MVSYSRPYIIDVVTFTTPEPLIRQNIASLLAPFDYIIWIILLINILVVFIINVFLYYKDYQILWAIISLLFKQQYIINDNLFKRFQMSGWLLASVVLTCSYSGCIYSQMTKPYTLTTIDSLYDLAQALSSRIMKGIAMEGDPHYHMILVIHILNT